MFTEFGFDREIPILAFNRFMNLKFYMKLLVTYWCTGIVTKIVKTELENFIQDFSNKNIRIDKSKHFPTRQV